jgi:hypothetical protein
MAVDFLKKSYLVEGNIEGETLEDIQAHVTSKRVTEEVLLSLSAVSRNEKYIYTSRHPNIKNKALLIEYVRDVYPSGVTQDAIEDTYKGVMDDVATALRDKVLYQFQGDESVTYFAVKHIDMRIDSDLRDMFLDIEVEDVPAALKEEGLESRVIHMISGGLRVEKKTKKKGERLPKRLTNEHLRDTLYPEIKKNSKLSKTPKKVLESSKGTCR